MLQNNSKRMMRDFYLGTQMPYHYLQDNEFITPDGYQPFCINYLGRHGGRYLANPEGTNWVFDILIRAYEQQGLTMRGLELMSKLNDIIYRNQDQGNSLSVQGSRMIEGIAKRMYLQYPKAFGGKLNAVATNCERTKDSRKIFVKELLRYTDFNQMNVTTNEDIDPVLKFYELDQEYLDYIKNGEWMDRLQEFKQRHSGSDPILNRIFREEFLHKNSIDREDKERFAVELFKIYTNQLDTNGVISLGYYFTAQEKYDFWERINLETYLKVGPGLSNQTITSRVALNLLDDFIQSSEEAIHSNEPVVNLRFAHSATILPLLCLLEISGMSEQTSNIYQIPVIWKNYMICPMAANLQWIFYRKSYDQEEKPEEILVQILYNEHSVKIPIRGVNQTPFYRWIDIRDYYRRKLAK